MPPALEAAWHTHGYYGSVSHNVKAIYQRYLGWYDGNPAHLWPHPPVEAARRYVDRHGRRRRRRRRRPDGPTTRATTGGSSRCSTTSCSPTRHHAVARALQADAFEQLGFGAENGTWRNAFLAGATELRHGQFGTPTTAASADLIGALTVPQVFDSIAIRIDGPRAWNEHLVLSWVITDDQRHLRHRAAQRRPQPPHRRSAATRHDDLHPDPTRAHRPGDRHPRPGSCRRRRNRDRRRRSHQLQTLVGLLAPVDPDFAIVTP